MGSMNPYSNWPIPGWEQHPFGGLFPGNLQQQMNAFGLQGSSAQSQQAMNYWSSICPGYGSTLPEDLRQIEMWKCDHCGSRFNDKVEKCKNCGSNAILRFDDPGKGARQMSTAVRHAVEMEAAFLGPWGMPHQQKTCAEAVAEFRDEVAAITGSRRPCWLSRCWGRFLAYLDGCGYRR